MKKLPLFLSCALIFGLTSVVESEETPFRIGSEGRAKLMKHRARMILEGKAKQRHSLGGDPGSETLRKNVFSNNDCGVDIANTFG
ncbi:MAG: hypothetical protein ACE5FU_04420, partial [Nitrospinota bacterium]